MRRVIAFAVAMLAVAGSASAQATDSSAAQSALRIVQLLEETGLNYEKRSPTSWMVRYKAEGAEDIPLVLAQADSILVLVAIASAGSDVKASTALFRELLKFNIDADYIKAGIDDDGDFLVRADVKLASLTATALKELLDQLATGANQLRPLFAKHRK